MINYLADRIFLYAENPMRFNMEEFVKEIGETLINEFYLNQYVKSIELLNSSASSKTAKGSYNEDDKVIKIYKAGMDNSLNNTNKKVPNLTDYERDMYRAILYVKTLIHELQHALQTKKVDGNAKSNPIEKLILDLVQKDKGFTKFCLYDCHPTETMAEITAFRTTKKIVDKLEEKADIPLLACYIKRAAALEEFYSYHEYDLPGPTECFFEFYDKEALATLKKELKKTEINLEDRVYYGIGITEEEYQEMVYKYGEYDEQFKKLQQNTKV